MRVLCLAAVEQEAPPPVGKPQYGLTPIPDPTILTTQASEKAVAALKELMIARIDGIERAAKDEGVVLSAQDARLTFRLDQVPQHILEHTAILQKLMEETSKGVDQQFAGRDIALAAALLAQKTSVDEQNKANAASSAKSECATTKQIDGITSVITASQKANADAIEGVKVLLLAQKQAIDGSIIDLKDRIVSADGRLSASITANTSRTEGGASVVNIVVIAISLLFGLIGAVGMIVTMTSRAKAAAH